MSASNHPIIILKF